MTTYNELAGLRVNYVSSDPTLNTGNEGQVWYNSTTGTLRSLVQLKAWSAAGNLPVAKNEAASDGTTTAGWTAGGSNTPAANTGLNTTEEYSGYTWASGGNLNTGRTGLGGSGFGTQTAAAVSGGFTQGPSGPTRVMFANTEEYNGSAWTSVTSMPTSLSNVAQCGIQTAGLSFGGGSGYALPSVATTLEYDGTNWTSGGNLNTAAVYQAAGIQTAALGMLANDTTGKGTEAYNGSTWTAVANRNTGRAQIVGFGTQALATIAGGYSAGPGSPQFTETEQWDGTAWSISPATLGTATRTGMGIGTQGSGTSGLLAGGFSTNYLADTQEFNSTIFSPATGAWASGGNLNTARSSLAGAGTQTASLAFGGYNGTANVTSSESYNGTSWTNTPSINTARREIQGEGTQTAALGFGGYTTTQSAATESWNGSSWTSVNSMNTARNGLAGAGTQTAGLAFGGFTTANTGATESWNGTSWTTLPASMNTARRGLGGVGTQTAALAFGGFTTAASNATESWNGTSWTTLPASMGTARYGVAGAGIQTAAIIMGGAAPGLGPLTITELWDGTNWTSVPPMANAKDNRVGSGTQTAALAAGGSPNTAATEEWTGTPSTGTASTLTTS